jgi:Zn-dependent peptidase ImmA (M78 family)
MAYLTTTKQEEIDNSVNQVLLQTNKSYPEDNLLDIVKSLDIAVKITDFGKFSDDISGVIHYGGDEQKPTIYLNEDTTPPERQTFTLAHELGHFLLHDHDKSKLRIDKFNYRAKTKEAREETEANYFAASLLMPKDKFKEVLGQTYEIGDVAKYFGVSEAAVANRIRWLKQN